MDNEVILSDSSPQNNKPITIKAHSIQRKGALGALKTIHKTEEQIIPALNTDIKFSSTLPQFKMNDIGMAGLSALDNVILSENFNWRDDGGDKSQFISKPENQMLCGSCWAMAVAGIVADNHVVAGTVNWKPNLSTTWCLATYPQLKCKGGNPAILLENISKNGIATNNCVDYSWCSENKSCNGKSADHFKEDTDLSELIPNSGCYDAKVPHYMYYIDTPTTLSLKDSELDPTVFTITLKKHIKLWGPVQGGFLVYKNFLNGAFSKINGGVYLETGIYDDEQIKFDKSQLNEENYLGAHAVAIIGWGIEKKIIINNSGTKEDVPYWYCRNSWTEKWADGGYFKMAMYPYNKISQFDNVVTIKTKGGSFKAGGIVMFKVYKKPEFKKFEQVSSKFLNQLSEPMSFYSTETTNSPKTDSPKPEPSKIDCPKIDCPKIDCPKIDCPKNNISITKYIFIGICIIVFIGCLVAFIRFLLKKYYFSNSSSKQLPVTPTLTQISPNTPINTPITQTPITQTPITPSVSKKVIPVVKTPLLVKKELPSISVPKVVNSNKENPFKSFESSS